MSSYKYKKAQNENRKNVKVKTCSVSVLPFQFLKICRWGFKLVVIIWHIFVRYCIIYR